MCVDYLGGTVYMENADDVEGFILVFDGLTQQDVRVGSFDHG